MDTLIVVGALAILAAWDTGRRFAATRASQPAPPADTSALESKLQDQEAALTGLANRFAEGMTGLQAEIDTLRSEAVSAAKLAARRGRR